MPSLRTGCSVGHLRFTSLSVLLWASLITGIGHVQSAELTTYCNPLNLDYGYCPIPNFVEHGKHRATADPVIINFRGDYYLFSTNQWGYWWSENLLNWKFVPRKFLKPWHQVYDELCAPGAFVYRDELFLIGSTHTPEFPLWKSATPRVDAWQEAVERFEGAAWDPAFLVDDDGRIYLYYGSSNAFPLYGVEMDAQTLQPKGERQELIRLHDEVHGWERFGEANDNTFLRPFMEGAWVTKHAGKYYLQYAAPGTEFSGYGDGVYISDRPLGPFTYQAHNPIAYKPGGFARGAGHGATFQDNDGHYWRTGTIVIGVKNNFERRLGMWPVYFDADGLMYSQTAYGDYPHRVRRGPASSGEADNFTGWMLLNYNKPVQVSSALPGHPANFAVDEDLRTYWSATSAHPGETLTSDLGAESSIHAIQINYADQDAEVMGKGEGLYHQYRLETSLDGAHWTVQVDKQQNQTDVPHDYVEFAPAIPARYVRLVHQHVPTGKLAISGLRVFGYGAGEKPRPVERLVVLRGASEPRNAWLKWQAADDATGYVIYCGIAPDKLYNSAMVYGASEYYWRALDADRDYYFAIEAFNENGISPRTDAQASPVPR